MEREGGQTLALERAATATVAFFVIHLRRNFAGLQALLGETITGIVCSDRWSVYNKLPLNLHQICWAHLKRDFQKLVDRGGPAEAIGRVGLDVVECLFADWWAFRRGELDRPGLQARLDPIRVTPRCFGARLLLRGFQGGDLLRQSLGTASGVVVVRVDRRCRAHEQPCGTHPPLGRAVAQEFLWLPQRGGVSVRGADVDRGTNPAVAETSGARLPVSRDRSPSVRPSRSAITGPGRGLIGYDLSMAGARASVRAQMSTMTLGGSMQPGLHDQWPARCVIEPIAIKPDPNPVLSDDRDRGSTAQTDEMPLHGRRRRTDRRSVALLPYSKRYVRSRFLSHLQSSGECSQESIKAP